LLASRGILPGLARRIGVVERRPHVRQEPGEEVERRLVAEFEAVVAGPFTLRDVLRLRAVSYDAVRVGRVLVDAELRVGIAVDVGIEGAGEHDRVVARIPFDARTERPGEPWLETWVTEALDAVDALETLACDEVFAPIERDRSATQVLQWLQRLRLVVRRLDAPVVV